MIFTIHFVSLHNHKKGIKGQPNQTQNQKRASSQGKGVSHQLGHPARPQEMTFYEPTPAYRKVRPKPKP